MIPSKRILLVEDDPAIVELIVRSLAPHGLAECVVSVSDGDAALAHLRASRSSAFGMQAPVAVLLDLHLPGSAGLEILGKIREDPALLLVPVVILSSSLSEREVCACYRAGANAFVRKPMSFNDFKWTILQTVLFWVSVNHCPAFATLSDPGDPALTPALAS